MKPRRAAAVAAILGFIGGTAATNHSTPAMFPHVPMPEPVRGGCAVPCSEVGPASFRWGRVHKLHHLDRCEKTQILDKNIKFPLERDDGTTGLRACTAEEDDQQDYGPTCGSGGPIHTRQVDIQLLTGKAGKDEAAPLDDVAEAARALANTVKVDPTCQEVSKIAKKGSAVVGLFVGRALVKSSAAPIVEKYVKHLESTGNSLPTLSVAQLCNEKGRASRHTFGIIVDTTGDIKAVHDALAGWHSAKCPKGLKKATTWKGQDIKVIPATALTMGAGKSVAASASTTDSTTTNTTVTERSMDQSHWSPRELFPRANCKTYEVKSGDDCWSIATDKCDLKNVDSLYKLNPNGKKLCQKGITPGDRFCCTKGTMPDNTPPANKDGTCKYVLVDDGDDCTTLAKDACDITPKMFYNLNGGGSSKFCNKIKKNDIMCCSKGQKPDLRPKKKKDGSCYWVAIENKLCAELKDEYFLKKGDLEKFNKGRTWGWMGCERLMPGQRICLSEGTPPLPAPDANAKCGPTVVGTKKPSGDKKFAELNPCPLNACCNTWGQCGTTKEVCNFIIDCLGSSPPALWESNSTLTVAVLHAHPSRQDPRNR